MKKDYWNLLVVLFFLLFSACGRNGSSFDFPVANSSTAPLQVISEIEYPPNGLQVSGYGREFEIVVSQKERLKNLDLLISIDNSASMDIYLEQFKKNLGIFLQYLKDSGVAVRLGFLKSTEELSGEYLLEFQGRKPILDSSNDDIFKGADENIHWIQAMHRGNKEIGASVFADAMENPMVSGFFRPDTLKYFISLSDTEDYVFSRRTGYSYDPVSVQNKFNLFFPNRWKFLGIGSPTSDPCVNAEEPLQKFTEALSVASTGTMARICVENYSSIMQGVIEGIQKKSSMFSIDDSEGESQLSVARVFVGSSSLREIQQDQFAINWSAKSISFSNESIPEYSEKILIQLETWHE